jgi:amino acid adenylation domain-containing protein
VVTYGELDRRANGIAHELLARGAGPDVVVGICAHRGPEMIAGALAVLKTGGAYLPLDASYPPERLSFILTDARCPLRLLSPGVPSPTGRFDAQHEMTIELDGPSTSLAPSVKHSAERLAYVIYTSGSMGRPKGVEITHASLLNLCEWHQRAFGVTAADRATQIAAVGFDAAVWEIWPYLAAGACIHIPDDAIRSDPQALRDWLLGEGTSICFVPTPMAERLLAMKWPRKSALRFLLTGGDTLHSHPPPGLPFSVVNNYGPTECTVVATSGLLSPYEQPDRRPSIGRPIDNTQIYILDSQMHEVPPGTVGELYIGGAGLARGYRGLPLLTASRFVPSPFQPGKPLYKTGDLARHLPTGEIAFVGRADDQIKIRGFRIEPSEIVATLNGAPGVVASVVVASDLGGGDKRLIAYVVLADGVAVAEAALREALTRRLPEYMVPSVFVRLPALPLGPHGKIDRSALPEPDPSNTMRDDEVRGPTTQVEKVVCDLVEMLLKVPRLSVIDNFFLVGGHSLFGTQLIARLRDVFGVEMSLHDVFQAPTVERLSARVEELVFAKLEAMAESQAPASPELLASEQP